MERSRSDSLLLALLALTLPKVSIQKSLIIFYREFNKAMKTAMRLLEYEKELGTKEVYSIVALGCYFNQCFKECSKAFVKLERLPDLTEKEREKYELLAI